MAQYKGFEFPDAVAPHVRDMPVLDDAREALALRLTAWEALAVLGWIDAGSAPLLEATGRELRGLGSGWLHALGHALHAQACQSLGSRAHEAGARLERRLQHLAAVQGQAAHPPTQDEVAQQELAAVAMDELLLLLVDAHDRIVASCDALRLPAGRNAPARLGADTVLLSGEAWLCVRRPAPAALAGRAAALHALRPWRRACAARPAPGALPAASGDGLLAPELLALPDLLHALERPLDRLLWSARARDAEAPDRFRRALLQSAARSVRRVRDDSAHTLRRVIDDTVGELQQQLRRSASLAIDLLARAVDTASADLRRHVDDARLASVDAGTLRAALAEWRRSDALPTPWVVFDATGRIIVAPVEGGAEGCTLVEPWVTETLNLPAGAMPWCSGFTNTVLLEGPPVCVLAAPRRADDRVQGGLALVIGGARCLDALLAPAQPEWPQARLALCRRDGVLVGGAHDLPATVPAELFALPAGQTWSGLWEENGLLHAVGVAAGGSTPDGRDTALAEVLAFSMVTCGRPAQRVATAPDELAPVDGDSEIATCLIGSRLVGVALQDVFDCIDAGQAVQVWRGGYARRHAGVTHWNERTLPLIDAGPELGVAEAPHRHALVLRAGDEFFGLLVSELGPIGPMKRTETRGAAPGETHRLFAGLARAGSLLIPVLDPEALVA